MTAISYPPVFINEYLSEKIVAELPDRFLGPLRFFPTSPTDINAMTQGFPEQSSDVFGVFDRMIRMRRGPFPHIKLEQIMYYLYKVSSNPEALIEATQVMQDLLDREDESAEEINEWIRQRVDSRGLVTFGTGSDARDFKPVYFHSLKIYQLEEAKDIIDFNTSRTFAANKIIVEYKYHVMDYS